MEMDMPGAFKEAEDSAPSLLPRYRTDIRDDERDVLRENTRYVSVSCFDGEVYQ